VEASTCYGHHLLSHHRVNASAYAGACVTACCGNDGAVMAMHRFEQTLIESILKNSMNAEDGQDHKIISATLVSLRCNGIEWWFCGLQRKLNQNRECNNRRDFGTHSC
jgi:hypothetical protein